MHDQIRARIAELEAERERLLTEANKQIYAYAVAINELRRLLAPVEVGPEPVEVGPEPAEQAAE